MREIRFFIFLFERGPKTCHQKTAGTVIVILYRTSRNNSTRSAYIKHARRNQQLVIRQINLVTHIFTHNNRIHSF